MARPSRDGESTREKILEVAADLIDRHGMDGLRLSEIAARVGIRPPSIFAHFEGRDAIGDAVAQRVIEQIAGLLGRTLVDDADPEARLRRAVRAYAGHMHDHPSHARLLLRDLARTRGGDHLEMTGPLVGVIGRDVTRLLEDGAKSGCFREYDGGAFVALLQGAVLGSQGWHGYAENGKPHSPLTRSQLQDQAEDLALRLLSPDAPSGPA